MKTASYLHPNLRRFVAEARPFICFLIYLFFNFVYLQLGSDGSYSIHWCFHKAIKTSAVSSAVADSFSIVRRSKQWPRAGSRHKLASQSAVSLGHFAEASNNKTCDVASTKKGLGEATLPGDFALNNLLRTPLAVSSATVDAASAVFVSHDTRSLKLLKSM